MAKSQYICRADSAHFPPSSLMLQGRFDVTASGRPFVPDFGNFMDGTCGPGTSTVIG